MNYKLLLVLWLCLLASHAFGQNSFQPNGRAESKFQAKDKLKLAYFMAASEDLPSIRVVSLKSGAVFTVYYDEKSKQTAEKTIPLLAEFYKEIAKLAETDAGKIQWASVVFTNNKNYEPPRVSGETRWQILTGESGELGEDGLRNLYQLIPHEQVHSLERTFVKRSPRWFAEGLATWLGLKITKHWNTEVFSYESERLSTGRAKLSESPNLKGWGGVSVKREAIMRQVSPELRT